MNRPKSEKGHKKILGEKYNKRQKGKRQRHERTVTLQKKTPARTKAAKI